MDNTPRQLFQTPSNVYVLQQPWQFVKELGQGAYGCVSSARHAQSGETCAVKKVTNVFTKKILTKRCLRELRLLHHFRGHKNITCLYDMDLVFDPPGSGMFNEVYLYEELMEADLHAIIRSGQPLSDAHFQSFIYQTLCGLKYIHSANVLHRDLKPGNLLVNADCELKICDFGLARGFQPGAAQTDQGAAGYMTEYVATRWYRAPEIMLSFANYTSSIDTWSVGCILAELLGNKPIFKGEDYVDQLNKILNYLGTPTEETLRRVGSTRAQEYIRSLPIKPRIHFKTLYPNASPTALDLLQKLLAFDPAKRLSCEEALAHPYLSVWHDPADEPVCEVPFDFSFENENETAGMRNLIIKEVQTFRQLVRRQTAPVPPRGHDLPPAPPPPQQPHAGVGPAFGDEDVNTGADALEHPGSALERELGPRQF
ncbi:kinase-like domain-containing protein [Dioszegia hungarica]|uniref:Mitogen-activated protein kinase n=1 Tax=Dioszegia hungarica TaxID=4972 RepID=A0AA38HGK5_9TREE|nr:kinase-like domain-containing protein [Dioszegia hungarica]KAI9639101.1 kinase-like domain-containing protein [Dioszegia hungarica]